MKTALIVGLLAAGLVLPVFGGSPNPSAVADNSDPHGVIAAVESVQLEALFAQGNQSEPGESDLMSMYNELKKLAKEYRDAKKPDAKSGLSDRANNIMGILFDAKVGREGKRIDLLEKRLGAERDRLKEMQLHKRDLVHKGVTKALDSGGQDLPEWATPAR
jgi:hypothetical protein